MPLTSSDKKTLENMVYRITCRMSAGEDDFDSDYERDLVIKLTNYLWEVWWLLLWAPYMPPLLARKLPY